MLVVVVAASIVVVLVLAVLGVRSTDLLIRRQLRRQVVVELQSGETFRGLLVAADARTILMTRVELLRSEQAASVSVDGDLLIPRGDVKYMQRP